MLQACSGSKRRDVLLYLVGSRVENIAEYNNGQFVLWVVNQTGVSAKNESAVPY